MRYLSAFAVALAVCVVWASPASAQLPFPLFEKPKAKPKKPPKKDAAKKDAAEAEVSWQIDLRHGGTCYFWLRYLPVSPSAKQHLKAFVGDKHVTTLGGGETDLHAPEEGLPPEFWKWAGRRFWTWARPVDMDPIGVNLPAGRHTLTLRDLARGVRYDALVVTNEPSYHPSDGRLRQARFR